ncbi:DUF5133 domain-containing protein [Streptomyces gilvosporeus]|uniref:DUF5133 domain-containing protein n=1 Tax=Streptomyces gilvosporeus TaxID=553510 RepID=UPI001F242612|nr:DUF5133 domain-containing protein [Streptomyces gilvosporeus]
MGHPTSCRRAAPAGGFRDGPRLEDVAHTLCVLTGRRTVREAVTAAESYLARS